MSKTDYTTATKNPQAEIKPAREPGFIVGWFNSSLKADKWFDRPNVMPRDAAMLLCGFNPEHTHLDPEKEASDETTPLDFRYLIHCFEQKASDVTDRSLMDWLTIAKEKRLKYHSWITEYISAAKLKQKTSVPNNSANVRPWVPEARKLGEEYLKKWRDAGYEPTTKDVALYVEGKFSTNGIQGKNVGVLDAEYILRYALKGITGNKPGQKSKKPKIPNGQRCELPKI